jgi:hypothetical protein
MTEETRQTRWEYVALSVGSIWGTGEPALQAKLNELGLEGWEVINVYNTYGSGKTTVVAKRPLTAGAIRRRHREAYGLEP